MDKFVVRTKRPIRVQQVDCAIPEPSTLQPQNKQSAIISSSEHNIMTNPERVLQDRSIRAPERFLNDQAPIKEQSGSASKRMRISKEREEKVTKSNLSALNTTEDASTLNGNIESDSDSECIVCPVPGSSKSMATSTPSKSKMKRKFRVEWQVNRKWLVNKGDRGRAFCKLCSSYLLNNVAHIKHHENGADHKAKHAVAATQPVIDDAAFNEYQKKQTKVKVAELLVLMFCLVHNLPFVIVPPLIALIQAVASDSHIAKDLKCGSTKATTVTNTILKAEGVEDVTRSLRKTYFSLIIDETTDISTKKCLAVVVRYFDATTYVVRDRFLSLIELNNCDAVSIHTAIIKLFSELQVPITNLIGFASDNASVMMGRLGGVQALLKKTNNHLYVMGCICHSLHLCSSAACKKLPRKLEKLARNIYSYFCHSSKRLDKFKELQILFNVKTNKLLKTSSTRWLSLESVVKRILENWDPLVTYFSVCEVCEENEDISKYIFEHLYLEVGVYFSFMKYVLAETIKLNLMFQAERPMMHTILPVTRTFLKTMLANFIRQEVILSTELHRINYKLEANFLEKVYLGPYAEELLVDENPDEHDIRIMSRKYYIEFCDQVLQRIDVNDKTLKSLEIINPKSMGPTLAPLFIKFPNIVTNDLEKNDLEIEWRSVIHQESVSTNLDLETFWGDIFKQKNVLDEFMYPNLKKFIGAMLCLPHSSACAERIFSRVALIKNKLRNRLEVPTVSSIMLASGLIDRN